MGFLFFPMMPMGLRLAALRAAGAPLLEGPTVVRLTKGKQHLRATSSTGQK